jgi:sodium transport system permease protein
VSGARWVWPTLVVLQKELRDAFRDRRSLVSILIGALFGPVIVGIMMNRLADRQREVEDVRVPVVGTVNAPALVEWLRQQPGVEVIAGPDDAERAVRDRQHDVVIVIPDDFATRFGASRPAPVKIVADGSRNTARPVVQRVRSLLQRYSAEIGSLRLVARGVSPVIATPLEIRDVEVSSAQQRAAMILNFLPLFIVIAAFTGGMQIATDSTAGERERGSLEPLLVNPAPRGAIASGKWLAATSTAILSVLITTSLCLAMLQFIPLQEFGVRFRIGPAQVLALLAAVLPLCPLASAAQTYLATFARSFKEAQSYIGFLILVPMIPGLLATIYPLGNKPWMYPIPMLGQHALLSDVLGGRPTSVAMFAAAALTALVTAALFVSLTTRLLHKEHIIFGR